MACMSCTRHASRVLLVAIAIVIIALLLSPSAGGFNPKSLYAYHPVAMTLAFALILPLGITAYVADLGAFGRRFPDRASRRMLHGTLQLVAVFLVLFGFMLHFAMTSASGGSHIARGDPTWAQVHVWFGLVTVVAMVLLVVVGMYKYVVRTREGHAIMKWHGYAGLAAWLCGLVTMCVGVYGVFWHNNGVPAAAIAIWVLLALVAITTLVTVFLDPTRKAMMMPDESLGHKMDDSSDLLYDGPRDSMGSLNGGGKAYG